MTSSVTVAIIDSHERSRVQVTETVRALTSGTVFAMPHCIGALEQARELRSDVVVVGNTAPIERSLQAVGFLRDVLPDAFIVSLAEQDAPGAGRVLRAGADELLGAFPSVGTLEAVFRRAEGRRARSVNVRGRGRVVSVVGMKGGIGKTTIASNTAALMAMTGRSTLLIDLDAHFGDVGIMLDADAQIGTLEAARSLDALDAASFRELLALHESGAHVLPAGRGLAQRGALQPVEVAALIDFASSIFDLTVLDTPGSFNESLGAAIEQADGIVAVTTADAAALRNTSMLLEYLDSAGIARDDVQLVLNHVHPGDDASGELVATALGRAIDLNLAYDAHLPRCAGLGRPAVLAAPGAAASAAFAGLARALSGDESIAVGLPKHDRGLLSFFRRLLPLGAASQRRTVAAA